MRTNTLIFVVCSLLAGLLSAQQTQPTPWFTTVRLTVEGQTDDTSEVLAWYSEELRRMQGVQIVDSGESWNISLLLLKNQNQGGVVTGYTISQVILERYDPRSFFRYMAQADTSRMGSGAYRIAEGWTHASWNFSDHQVHTMPVDAFRRTIEELAAKFDAEELEPSRKSWDKFQHDKSK